jgi:hypothetical protein
MRILKLPAVLIAVSQLAIASTPAAPAQRARPHVPAATAHRARPQAPATAARGCDLATMPALPGGADGEPPERAGFEWTPGHYACTGAGWSYRTGHWQRAGTSAPVSAFVVPRGRGIAPRAGYRFVRQGNGVTVARMAGGGRSLATSINGTFMCYCRHGSGKCDLASLTDSASCISSNDHPCTGECRMSVVITGVAGVTISRRDDELPVFLSADCRRGARLAAAAP